MMNDLRWLGDSSVMVHMILASFFFFLIIEKNYSPSFISGFQVEPDRPVRDTAASSRESWTSCVMWTKYLHFLSLSFPNHEMGITLFTQQGS